MERITTTIKQADGEYREREYLIYRREEADEAGVEYKEKYWECEPGEYGLTKDGYVVLCVRKRIGRPVRKQRNKRGLQYQSTYLRFSIGRVIAESCLTTDYLSISDLTWEDRREIGDYTNVVPRTWDQVAARKKTTKRAIDFYTDLWLEKDGKLTEEDFHNCGILFRHDEEIPKASFKRLLRGQAIKDMVDAMLKDKLKAKGITEDSVIDMYLETYEQAKIGSEKGGSHSAVMRSVANDLMALLEKTNNEQVSEVSEFDDKLLEATLRDEILLNEEKGWNKQLQESTK